MISHQVRRSKKRKNRFRKSRLIEDELREILFIFFCFIGLYLFVSLITYAPNNDPGIWRNPQAVEIQNQGGIVGALFADLFFYLFGYLSYLFPLMVAYIGWLIYQGEHYEIFKSPQNLIIPTIGLILTLSAGCGLAIVHFMAESALLPTHAGGLLGIWVGKNLESIVDSFGATVILLALFFTGVTLLTGFSWLKLMDRLGYYTLLYLPIIKRYLNQKVVPIIIKYATILLRLVQHWYQAACTHWQQRKNQQHYTPRNMDNSSAYHKIWQDHEPIYPIPSLLPTTISLLKPPSKVNSPNINWLAERMTEAFAALQVQVEVNAVYPGPVLTNFEVQTLTYINSNYLDELGEALKKELEVEYLHIVENELGVLEIQIQNWERQTIFLSELLKSPDYQNNNSPLAVALGKNINGKPVIVDLRYAPHLLIVSSDNSEKNMTINAIILSLLYKSSPETMRMILIDDTNIYADLPHLISPVITNLTQIPEALNWCVQEMKRRYHLMASRGVRNIEIWHQDRANAAMPYIILIIKDLDTINGIEEQVGRSLTNLVQKSRAAGIHLILAIASSGIDMVTALIKTHIPTRIAFKVATPVESRRILATNGAEILLGDGDMLYMTAGILSRVHGSFVSEQEVQNVVADLKARATPDYVYFKA